MKKETVDIIKGTLSFGASIGAGMIAGFAMKVVTPSQMKIFSKIAVGLGAAALGGIASEKAGDYMDRIVDDAIGIVNAFKDGFNSDESVVEEA